MARRQPRKTPVPYLELALTKNERDLILNDVTSLDADLEAIVKNTPVDQPLKLTWDDLDVLGEYLAAEASITEDKKLEKKLDRINDKIIELLDQHADKPKAVKIDDARRNKALAESAASIKAWLAQLVMVSDDLKIGKEPLQHFWLSPAHRDVLVLVPGVSKAIKKKLGNERSFYSVAEVASMATAVADDLLDGQPSKQAAVLIVAMHLMDRLKDGIVGTTESAPTKGKRSAARSKALYQFKITLLDSQRPIWRRIQIEDCTLDKLHEHIQTAMGWTNSHLHQFDINGERYGDPELLDDGVGDMDIEDSTTTMLSEIVPRSGNRFRFVYEYDFGDGWKHEILFEGCPKPEKVKKFPLCLEGERACPPEDIGGVGGYEHFLEVIADPQHEEHADMREWIGGKFDAEKFDPKVATKAMKTGLPDWREEDEEF